jgi:hypothetical protein
MRMQDKFTILNSNSFNKVEEFSHLRTTLMYQNSIQEEIKSRMNSGNPCYHSVQNFLSSSLLSKTIQIQNYNSACCFAWM